MAPLLFFVLRLENLYGHIVDCGVVENNDAPVRSGFDVNAAIFAKLVVRAAEVVANSLGCYVQTISDEAD